MINASGKSLLVMAVFVLATGICARAQTAPTAQAPGGNGENGKKLFTSFGCYECHGTVGQGGTGPRIAPTTISVSALLRYVRQPSGQMPPYSAKVATDRELTDIYEYLKSIAPPNPAASARLLNQ
jgi:ubiquinol-cytochrome c reductase cytochrome c subunit